MIALIAILVLVIWRWANSIKKDPLIDDSTKVSSMSLAQMFPTLLFSSKKVNRIN